MSITCSLMVLLECKTEKGNADSQWRKQVLFACANKVWLAVNHKLSVTSANEFDVRSVHVLHGQVSLTAVNHIYVFHEVINGCKI